MSSLLDKFTHVVDGADDEVYDNYVETTKHPGDVLFAIAICVSVCGIVGLPLIVRLGRHLLLFATTTTKEHDNDDDEYGDRRRTTTLAVVGRKRSSQPDDDAPHCSLLGFLWTIVKFDDEARHILRLAVPLICSANVDHATQLMTLAIISNYMGTDAMVAYSMVHLFNGITSSFVMGWIDAIDTRGSMAYGAKNYELTGQYVRASCLGHVLCMIPASILWGTTIGRIMLLLGFKESMADMAHDFVWVYAAYDTVAGLNVGAQKFLAVIGREMYANVVYCLERIATVTLVAVFLVKVGTSSLRALGVVMLMSSAAFLLVGNILIPIKLGYLTKYKSGLLGRRSNGWSVAKDVFDAALPCAFNKLCEESEWEVMTIFASMSGPAEAATWATMGFIWNVFEATTEAIGNACEMRVAYHLGKGRPDMAKLAGYKTMFLALVTSIWGSAIFTSLNSVLPSLLTKDATIQRMLLDLFPLLALSSVSMGFGMVAWTAVGGQGRNSLATKIAIACSFFVTCPIAGVLTVWMKINLQSLMFAMHSGYTLTGTLLCACLQLSDWEALSEKVQEQMRANPDEFDSDSDESSTASSSSSNPEVEEDDKENENKKNR